MFKDKNLFLLASFAICSIMLFIYGSFEAVSGASLAMAVCGLVDGNVEPDCDFLPQSGVEDTLYLINKSQIASVVYNNTNTLIVEDIILESGASAFKVIGMNNSNNTTWDMISLRFGKMYTHLVSFIGFDLSPAGYEQYKNMKDSKLVAVVINNFRGEDGNGAIKIYGLSAGLVCKKQTQDMSSEDTQGAVQIEFQSDSDNKIYEPTPPHTLFVTDFATSKAIIEALV